MRDKVRKYQASLLHRQYFMLSLMVIVFLLLPLLMVLSFKSSTTARIQITRSLETYSQYAYVTLLSSELFLPGAVALIKSLQLTRTRYDIVVLILDHLHPESLDVLCQLNVHVLKVDYIDNPYIDAMVSSRQLHNFAKLRAWQLVKYDRIVVLDSDMLILQNVDHLFKSSAEFAAVLNYESPFSKFQYQANNISLSQTFNTGLMVIKPSLNTFNQMVGMFRSLSSYNGGDQGFINAYLQSLQQHSNTSSIITKVLPLEYNVNKMMAKYNRSRMPPMESIFGLHFVRQKPWYDVVDQWQLHQEKDLLDSPSDYESLNRLWRTVLLYDELTQSDFEIIGEQQCFTVAPTKEYSLNKLCVHVVPHFGPQYLVQLYRQSYHESVINSENEVTLVTQISINRLERLIELCSEWTGPISVALWISGEDSWPQSIRQILLANIPWNRVSIHLVVQKQSHPYPINYLRNLAAKYAPSDLIFISDADFMLSDQLYQHLTHYKHASHIRSGSLNNHVYVVHAFEYVRQPTCLKDVTERSNRTTDMDWLFATNKCQWSMMHLDKEQLRQMNDQLIVTPFHVKGKGHRATNTARWWNATSPYYIQWEEWYEPYLILRKSQVKDFVMFDERFVDRGRNKLMLALQLHVRGFRYVVLPEAFIIHRYESKEQEQGTRLGYLPSRHQLYQEIDSSTRQQFNCSAEVERAQSGFCNLHLTKQISAYDDYVPIE
ncbi:hypothetical protein MIR68_007144 [Amoeboaphelidium protococcarum]|nr:hypothetical protein MIR68_007144 [Amoeboaphelidium protococcarum]